MDTRSRDILVVLLQAKTPTTVRQIAEQLKITPRMLRSNLEVIGAWLGERGARLVRKPNYGIYIDAPGPVKERLLHELTEQKNYLPFLSQKERIDLMICLLMCHGNDLFPTEQVESALGISRPTLLRDISKVEAWFRDHDLTLVYKPRRGFLVLGSEPAWREAMTDFLLTSFGVVTLLLRSMNQAASPSLEAGSSPKLLNGMLLEALQTFDLADAYPLVKSLEQILHCKFTDDSLVTLICHLGIAVGRIQQGRAIPENSIAPDDRILSPEANAVRLIAQEIQSTRHISFNEVEIDYFTRQILGAKAQHSLSDLSALHKGQEERPVITEIAANILTEASLYLHPSLKVDQQLARALAYHIQVAYQRIRYNLPIRNPLLGEIQTQYPYIFRIARKSVTLFEEKVHKPIPDDEIAYIAMHLGAAMERLRPYLGLKRRIWIVCGEGVATAWLLISRVQAEFPELEISEVTSALEVTLRPPGPGQIDAILSTVPIDIPGIFTLEVSPLLNSEDQAHIREALQLHSMKKFQVQATNEDHQPPLASLITEQTIQVGASASNWEEVVEITGGLLRDTHAIHSRYIEAMKEVIWKYGPYVVFSPGAALLHARPEDGVMRVCMSLVTLSTPVQFGHPIHDPVYLAIGLGVVDDHLHLRALAQLAQLLSDQQKVAQFKAAQTKGEVLKIISGITETK
jgi:transcriptional antiterminator/mannitol/fructose-specific phosphotransferase system IIA component (Ntr-type)